MSAETVTFNGINATTGRPLLPPLAIADLARLARGEVWQPQHRQELAWWYRQHKEAHLGPIAGVDARDLAQVGWGVVFAAVNEARNEAIREALRPLLTRRREQAGDLYREYIGATACRQDETKLDFLARHGAGPGPVVPTKVPYYLLLVGDPEAISFRFQHELDVQYAVGRVDFEHLEAYASYAQSVVAAETGTVSLPRRAVFAGVQNSGDQTTALTTVQLVAPLATAVQADQATWQVETRLGDATTKAGLQRVLGGDETPAFLFTASHGVGLDPDDPRQRRHQGALLCQEWPGPSWDEPVPEEFYLSADDVGANDRLLGLISFHFACYGAGTPAFDSAVRLADGRPAIIADRAFSAAMPGRLLGHAGGGALAAISHVDRAWTFSFNWNEAGPQLAVFRSALRRLFDGYPVGAALEDFNVRYAELSTALTGELEHIKLGKRANEVLLANLWTANNDARGYAIVGDPAVRLAVAGASAAAVDRPALVQTVSQTAPASPPTGAPERPVAAAATAALDEPMSEALRRLVDQLAAAVADQGERVITTTLPGGGTIHTRLTARGDISTELPATGGPIDEGAWAAHRAQIEIALAARVSQLTAVTAALARLRGEAPS